MNTPNNVSRQAAYLALLEWQNRGTFLWDFLQKWKKNAQPDARDLNFAYELACGSMRFMRLCDHIASLSVKKLPAKPKERFLLRLAIYQLLFLKNIPAYAVVNTSVALAKNYCHSSFASFLNAFLRNWKEPNIETVQTAIRYSYPDFFVEELNLQYGEAKTIELLERGNTPPLHKTQKNPFGYIQNQTQYELISQLASSLQAPPCSILDMCAAPGGKTLCLHNLFPAAAITANEASAQRIQVLQENLLQFSCNATVLNMPAEDLQFEHPFDLVLVDAPCSNSGVLYKCPEARWRLSHDELQKHTSLQFKLLEKAYTFACPKTHIWYMTCSILAQENEQLIKKFSSVFPVAINTSILQLPDTEGHDGGYACQISILN
jgi:16S rRNA (cytosine967-C5)-methyltransferase